MPFTLPAWVRRARRRRTPTDAPPATLADRFAALRHLPRFLRLIWATNPRMALTGLLLRLVRAGVPLAALYVGQLIVDEVVRILNTPGASLDRLWLWVGLELGIALVNDLTGRLISLQDALLGDLFTNASSVRLMQHAAALDLDHFEDAAFYDKLERARRQTLSRTVLLQQVLGQVQEGLSLLFLLGGLVAFNPWLLLLLLVAVLPAFVGETHFNAQAYSLVHGWTPERRELDYLRYSGASDETAKEVKIFGLSEFLVARFRRLSDRYYAENRRISVARAWWGSLLAAVGTLGYYGAYVLILLQTVGGAITLGQLVFLSGTFQRLRSTLEGMLSRFAGLAENALYLRDFFDFFDLQPRIAAPAQPRPYPQPLRRGWTFEDVGFRYQNAERWALRHVSFGLAPGERLALVGENGAGKTTLVKLLARLYDPSEGRILLDGTDLRDYDPAELRARIGVIFQDFIRFQFTAGENIAVGRVETLLAPQQGQTAIEAAARQSLADTVVARLPQGYAQVVGRRFAGGVDLSGGEWQKIALARAYLRGGNNGHNGQVDATSDPGSGLRSGPTLASADLLILDEPTAALDARAEHEVFQRFTELTAGRAAVLISHRFSTVRMADRIAVLGLPPGAASGSGSTLLELGTHTELLAQGGLYAELFQLQARGYR